MKLFIKTLFAELNQQLRSIHSESNKQMQYCKPAIKAIIETLEKLKDYTKEYKFKSQAEEINFFKTIKPKLTTKLIYYIKIYHIETGKITPAKKHYQKELKN